MDDATEESRIILDRFATRTGLDSDRPPRRYLWTDAFAVTTWVGLGEIDRARALVEQVHRVLGRHRDDDPREGWISGLDEAEGEAHPTAGGLRIGKPLPERGPGEAYDPQQEWDRDGQYFHYLTRWMHALDQLAHASGEPRYRRQAQELAVAAHRGFVRRGPDDTPRMIWKASIDLSRPLVPSMGHHDPLEGLVLGVALGLDASHPEIVEDYAALCRGRDWTTSDPLGIGGLLLAAARTARLERPLPCTDAEALALDALHSLASLRGRRLPDLRGLAFRQLGLALGLRAVPVLDAHLDQASLGDALRQAGPLADAIVAAWSRPEAQQSDAWTAHEDINAVTLAAALAPEGCVRPAGPKPR